MTNRDDARLVHLRELPKAGVALAVLGVSTVVALEDVPEWEERLFEEINQLPKWLEPLLWAPMQLGSLFGPVIVAVGIGSWFAWKRWRPPVGAIVAGVASWQLAKVVKELVARGRPFEVFEEIVRRMGTPNQGLGFVSGHSAVAFSLAAVLSPYVGRWRWVGYGLAGLVAFARIHVGAHLPLDTVGGAALGLGIAFAYNAAVGVPTDTRHIVPRRQSAIEVAP